jgi:hypothetical protein
MVTGRVFASFLVAGGALSAIFLEGVSGVWLVLMGLYIGSVAQGAARQLELKQALDGVTVAAALSPADEFVAVPAEVTLDEAESRYSISSSKVALPVVHRGELVGMLDPAAVDAVPSAFRASRLVWDAMSPADDDQRIAPDVSMLDALKKMSRHGLARLIVVARGRLLGVITMRAVLQRAETRQAAGA